MCLAVDVRAIVGTQHVLVVFKETLYQWEEGPSVAIREDAVPDHLDRLGELWVEPECLRRSVTLCPPAHYLLGCQPEQKEIVRADLFANLDVRPVERPDGERAVEGKLHVAGA